jgi:hypothetical protein
VTIPEPVLGSIKVKVKKATRFSLVWNSQGSMSRYKIGIWEATIQLGGFKQNKASVCLQWDTLPGRTTTTRIGMAMSIFLEVTDTSGNFLGGIGSRMSCIDTCRTQLVSDRHGVLPIVAILSTLGNQSPSDDFVALGFIGSRIMKQPGVKSLRCLPRSWCKESTYLQKIWDDSGSSGRQGSVWTFNTMDSAAF